MTDRVEYVLQLNAFESWLNHARGDLFILELSEKNLILHYDYLNNILADNDYILNQCCDLVIRRGIFELVCKIGISQLQYGLTQKVIYFLRLIMERYINGDNIFGTNVITPMSNGLNSLAADFVNYRFLFSKLGMVKPFMQFTMSFMEKFPILIDTWFDLLDLNLAEIEDHVLQVDHSLLGIASLKDKWQWKLIPFYSFVRNFNFLFDDYSLFSELIGLTNVSNRLKDWIINSNDLSMLVVEKLKTDKDITDWFKYFSHCIDLSTTNLKNMIIADIVESLTTISILQEYHKILVVLTESLKFNSSLINDFIITFLTASTNPLDLCDPDQVLTFIQALLNQRDTDLILSCFSTSFTPFNTPNLLDVISRLNSTEVANVLNEYISLLNTIPFPYCSLAQHTNVTTFLYTSLISFFGNRVEINKKLVEVFYNLSLVNNGSIIEFNSIFNLILDFLYECYIWYLDVTEKYGMVQLFLPNDFFLEKLSFPFNVEGEPQINCLTVESNLHIFEKFLINCYCSLKAKEIIQNQSS